MIRFLDLQKVTACHAEEYQEAMRQVVDSGWFLQGEQTRAFESAYASFIGTRHCIGVGNGLDALTLIYRAYIEMGRMLDDAEKDAEKIGKEFDALRSVWFMKEEKNRTTN